MTLTGRFQDALSYATALHNRQQRKVSGVPYVAHLLGVAGIALEHGANEDEAIAALLHDAIEDQGGASTREEIRRRFGDTVVEIVDGCTDTDQTPKPPWKERKTAFIIRLNDASDSICLVVAADKLHNARSILASYRTMGAALWEHFRGGRDGTIWYYRTIVQHLHSTGPSALVDELDRVVTEIERLVAKTGP